MSRKPKRKAPTATARQNIAAAIVAAVTTTAVALAVLSLLNRPGDAPAPARQAPAAHEQPAQTPQPARAVQGTEAAEAAGVQVAAPSVDFGRVPLDTPVTHSFVLHNQGAAAATLGQARIEVLEGC